MKKFKLYSSKFICFLLLTAVIFAGCEKKEELNRDYEGVRIVGVKINNELFQPTYNNNITTVAVPAGKDLAKVKLQLLVANGELVNFVNNEVKDVRKPLEIALKGFDGSSINTTLKIQSPPSLSSFIIEGLTIASKDIHFSNSSLIVQVPQGTNLTALKVTMGFLNGSLVGFNNGQAVDYTNPTSFTIKGVDGETSYNYDFIITSETVGPASVRSMTVNGIATDSVVLVAPNILIPYVKGLTNFANTTVTIAAGFGNKVDPGFTGANVNLLTSGNTVKITGTDGIQKQFTIGVPQVSLKPVFSKEYSAFGFGLNDMVSVAFSGSHIVVPNYSATAPTVVGPNYYDLTGAHVGVLDKTGTTILHSLRKVATDENGVILGVPLGINAGNSIIYKWNNVTAAPTPYITYSQSSLPLSYAPRSAGINVTGNLNGEAIITVAMAQKQDVFIWKVTGGVLNPTPTKYTFPYSGTSFYFGIEPMPIGTSGFIGAAAGNNFNGIINLSGTMDETAKVSGLSSTDCKVYKLNGRTYLGFVVFALGKGAYFRIADITDNQTTAIQNPIFNVLMSSTQANANLTMDVDLAKINGKLHAVFACTNIGMQLYKLEQ